MYYDYEKLKYNLKTSLIYEGETIGPGVIRILELVRDKGTLSEAYKIMGLSSSKAWRIIKKAEEELGFKLIVAVTGGVGGGHSKLTPEGEDFVERYQNFVKEVDNKVEILFEKHFNYGILK